eukprot:14153537-Alexandrium_andersonii.AAC.1
MRLNRGGYRPPPDPPGWRLRRERPHRGVRGGGGSPPGGAASSPSSGPTRSFLVRRLQSAFLRSASARQSSAIGFARAQC